MRTNLISTVLALSAATAACNVYDDVDSARSRNELIEEAKAALDQGDCSKTIAAVNAIGSEDDEILKLRGWGELCSAGVTVNKVMGTILTYQSTSGTDFKVVGNLANRLVPMTSENIDKIGRAVNDFNGIRAQDVRSVNLALAHITKAAALVAKYSSDSVRVRRPDIYSSAACIGATCASAPASCDPGMTDTDANLVADALDGAATAANLVSGLGAIRDLAAALQNNTGVPRFTRCTIVNNMLDE